jgi:hypothetical protein
LTTKVNCNVLLMNALNFTGPLSFDGFHSKHQFAATNRVSTMTHRSRHPSTVGARRPHRQPTPHAGPGRFFLRPLRGKDLKAASRRRYYLDMRIVVAGERAWACDELATVVLQRLIARYGRKIVIVHGGEAGVDESFNKACKSLGIAVEARLANWPQTGPPILWSKNRELVKDGADLCVALHRSIGTSRRTRDCERQAIQNGIPTYLITDEQAIPSRLTRADARLSGTR